ncbi:MAG: cytochrome-c peroxidase [Gemmatimonas sp.]
MRRSVRVLAAAAACGSLACADEGVVTPADPFAPVTTALTIDPGALPSYAAQAAPGHFVSQTLQREVRNPLGNAITDAGATLGRVLFFDRQLSRANTISCASCHQQQLGFGDTARFSVGFDGTRRTTVHSMRLGNARFNENGRYFWDRRALSLEAQTTQPVRDAVEMGFDDAHGGFAAVITRLGALPYYPPLFTLAFGDATITEDRVQRALAQYVRSILAVDSRWDRAVAQLPTGAPNSPPSFLDPLPGFTAQERRGQELYFRSVPQGGAGCQTCHVAPSFSLSGGSNSNGLDAGQQQVFRSPSLKNVALGRRFMHDGRFGSLEEVVAFYDQGVQSGPSLDTRLRQPDGQPRRLNLSADDRASLVAFLRTLTDLSVTTDPRFADPFRRR